MMMAKTRFLSSVKVCPVWTYENTVVKIPTLSGLPNCGQGM